MGANVTLRNVMTFDSMAFSACPTLNFTGCTLTNSSIKGVPAGNDTLTTNASTNIDFCAISVTGVTAGNRWCSVADPSIFSGCTFTGSGATGHAIRITTPGAYSFSGNIFNGFGVDGSNFAAIHNDSGGLVTLSIVGVGNTPSVRNGAGASTVVNNSKTLTITGLVAGSDVVVRVAGASTILASVDANAGSTWDYSYTTIQAVDIDVIKPGLVVTPLVRNFTLPSSSSSLPVSQRFDRNYL